VGIDRDVLPAGERQVAVIKVTLDAIRPPVTTERPPINLGLVLDRSGSMSGSKIEKARDAAVQALRRLDRSDVFSLVIYDHEVDTLVPAQSASRLEWIESRIQGIQPRGNTALFGGVSQGAAEIRKHLHSQQVHRIILLSDGLANVGPSAPADLARLGSALLKEGISVSTVGLGIDFNEDLMTQLAQASDGNHYFVESSADLPRIFARELGDVLSVVARQVLVEVDCPDGVRPLRIIGRDGHIKGNQVQLYMNQLYGGQEKYALIEVEIPAGTDGSVLDVASATCTYENTLNRRQESASGKVQARFSDEMQQVQQSVNVDINRAVLSNEMAVTRDEALDLYNAGDYQQAAQHLRSQQQKIQQRNVDLGLPGLAEEADALEDDAQIFEQNTVDTR
jgi:Ca-activated chloride channel family protein